MGKRTNKVGPGDDIKEPVIRRSSVARVSGVVPADTSAKASNVDPEDTGVRLSSAAHEDAGGSDEPAQIRSDIEHTRADLSETISALQEKLDPARIAEQVKDQIREKATEAYDTAKQAVKEATIGKAEKIMSNVSETVTDVTGRAGTAVMDTGSSFVHYVRDNPVPFALVGIGLGMLALSTRKNDQSSSYPYSISGSAGASQSSMADRARSVASGVADTAREATERATSAVSSAASSVRDAASTAADTTRQQLSQMSDQVRQGTRIAGERYNTMLQDNPMALGIAALAAGAIVGLTLPTTRIESEYMGEAREHLMDQAKSAAQEVVGKVQRVAGEAGNTLKEAAQKEGLVTGS